MKWVTFLFATGLLTGCSDYLVTKVEVREPNILVHPLEIDFNHLVSGEESDSDNITIVNVGDNDLIVDPPFLIDDDGRYTVTESGEVVLGPGELIDIEISYIPITYETNEAQIEIYSNDEDEPVVVVPIIGYGDAPVITVDPLDFDYGTISLGCDNEERITIGNDGNLPLEVSSVTQMVTQPADIVLEYGSLPDPPWIIDPGMELDFLVSYIPEDTGLDSSIITIDSSDPMTPIVESEQYGETEVERWITDYYEQEEIPLLDVLWVIDNSGSMNVVQSSIASHIDDFMTVFLAASPDYHMAFITTDSGAFEGGQYLDTTTASPELVASSIVSGIGTHGSAHEKGIQFAEQSTLNTIYAGPGGDFFREDATLVIIFVSDEPDHSDGGWAAYTHHFDTLKDSDKFLPVAIVGDSPSGCTGTFGSYTRTIPYGSGYYDFIDYYGGQFYSICESDWGIQMEDLADTVSTKRAFPLSESNPVEDTIEVYINGQLTDTSKWEYNDVDNEVRFGEGEEPEEGDTIELVYAIWGCE